ncbi:MAG: DUF4160 domain-containing protein [Pseudomonadota bacterium]
MPTVLCKYGFRFHFYGSDMDEPAHIHISGHGGVAKVWLSPIGVEEAVGIKANDLKRALSVVHEHQSELFEAWDEFFRDIR